MHYYTVYTTEHAAREVKETLNVDLARRMIVNDIAGVVSDLMFLSEHIEQQGLFALSAAEKKQRIAQEFLVFARKKGLYDQIRYLDRTGMEVVRVNYHNSSPGIVPEQELQNKSNRYYFREAMALSAGGVYLSPLDLNIENDRIEMPHKPMMRFGTPLFNNAEVKQGIVLLNYFGSRLIDNFTQAAANIADHVQLINQQGYWLSSPRHEDEWGFMYGRLNIFKQRFPAAWSKIIEGEAGQFQTKSGLHTFATIYPLAVALKATDRIERVSGYRDEEDRFWKIVSTVSAQDLSATLPLFIQNHLALYLAMLALLTLGAWFLAHSQHRRQLAETQREYEQRFRHTLENINLAAVAFNREGRVTFCNDCFLNITGWHRHEILSRRWVDLFMLDNQDDQAQEIILQMNNPDHFPSQYEHLIMTRNGKSRLLAWNNTLSYDAEGHVIGFTGIGEDITEQRDTEAELRKLSQAVEQSPSVVLITNKQGLIEYVNPKFTEVSGYSYSEVIGKNPRLLKSGETTSEEYADLWQTVAAGGEWRGEFHNRKKSGELYWESAAISGIRDADGALTHFLAVKEDITEQKRLEKEVETRNLELARSQALAAMGRMASMIAHDLRNPLSSVKMTLQILGKQHGVKANEEADELRQISLSQIRYMEDILSDMLTYSRPDAIKPEWITIDKVIDMAVSLSQRNIEEYEVILNTRYHAGLPTLYGDATKLRQVFANLITNAAQATNGVVHSKVTIDAMVELGESGTAIRVEICDNGCGIDSDEQSKIFEPFFTTRTKGTGLGLAIVKRILDQHNADIQLLTNPQGGACVSVVLPVTPKTVAITGATA